MDSTYFDRWGKQHSPTPQTTIRDRAGVWFVLVHDNAILFTHPDYAPLVPDLPGGGIDEGETVIEAAYRELFEETELRTSNLKIKNTYKQDVGFFAEDEQECWNYNQTFLLVTNNLKALYFKEKRKVTEGYCEWINLENIKDYTINHTHQKALHAFGLLT